MAKYWTYLLIAVGSLTTIITAHQNVDEGRQLTGQEVFCLNLARECPANLQQGPICASTAENYPNECEFWRENCRRKSVQRMTLVARRECTEDYCPQHCRGEVKNPVCANYINAVGVLKEKTYRNYCKFREAKCKQRNVYNIDLNYLYRGECGYPITTTRQPQATTEAPAEAPTEPPQEREAESTTPLPDEEEGEGTTMVFATEFEKETVSTEDMEELEGTTLVFEMMDETISPEDLKGTQLPEEMEDTPSPEDLDETPSPEDLEGTPSPEDLEGTPSPEDLEETPSPEEMEGTPSPEDVQTTIIFEEDTTDDAPKETPPPLEGTALPEDETTVSQEEMEGTPSPEEMEETTIVEKMDGTGTPSLIVEMDGTIGPSPEDLMETPSPEDTDGTQIPGMLTSAAPDDEEGEELVDVLRQCLEEYQTCFDEVSTTDNAVDVFSLFFQCMQDLQDCLGEDPIISMAEMKEELELGPSK